MTRKLKDTRKYECVIWEKGAVPPFLCPVSSPFIFLFPIALSQFRGLDYLGAWNRLPNDVSVEHIKAERLPLKESLQKRFWTLFLEKNYQGTAHYINREGLVEVEGSYVLRILHLVKEKHLSGKDLQKFSSTEASAVTFSPLTLTIVQS